MRSWLLGIGGRIIPPSVVGVEEFGCTPWLDVRKVVRLFGGQIYLHDQGVTVCRQGRTRRIQGVRPGCKQTVLAPVEAIAHALGVPVAILPSERIVRLGRNEMRLTRARVIVMPLTEQSVPSLLGFTRLVASRVVGWLCLHGAEARLVEAGDIGHGLCDGVLRIGIQYALGDVTEQRSEAFYSDRVGQHLAIAMQCEVVWATGRLHGAVTRVHTEVARRYMGGASSIIQPAYIREAEVASEWMHPWRTESEATGIFCGVRRYLDEKIAW